jgi:hypothetical protein
MLIAIVAVLVGVFFAATGRGGEMSYEPADQSPLDLGPVTAADVALLRPPTALWGYNVQVTDEALEYIARAMRERDVKIAHLQEQLTTLTPQSLGGGPDSAHARADAGLVSQASPVPGSPPSSTGFGGAEDPTLPDSYWVPGPLPTSENFAEPDILPSPGDSRAPEAEPLAEAPAPPETEPFSEAPVPPEAEPVADLTEGTDGRAFPQEPEPHEAPQPQERPQTPLVLKASAPPSSPEDQQTAPPPESYEATQPSAVMSAEEPEAHATQPSEIPAAGPQGVYDTHGWWAEQKQAAREEALRQAAGLEADDAGAQEQDR